MRPGAEARTSGAIEAGNLSNLAAGSESRAIRRMVRRDRLQPQYGLTRRFIICAKA